MMNTIKAFFLLLGQSFQFLKRLGESPLRLPANCAPDMSADIRIHPKKIVSTSHQNFNNSIKIAAENS